MATKTLTFSTKTGTTGTGKPKSEITYSIGSVDIPLFSTVSSITPSFTHTYAKGVLTAGSISGSQSYTTTTSSTKNTLTSGTNITSSSATGTKTIHAGNCLDTCYFNTEVSSGLITYVRTHEVKNFKLTYNYTPFDYNIVFAFEKSDTGELFEFSPRNNRNITGSLNSDGITATVTVVNNVFTGYKFKGWKDQIEAGIENTSLTRSDLPVNVDATYIAVYEPISYTINYFDTTISNTTPMLTETYFYNQTYTFPDLPMAEIQPGYKGNQNGWCTSNTGSFIDNKDNKIYDSSNNPLTEKSGNFSNLTYTDGTILNYYYSVLPIRYYIEYIKYTGGTTANFSINTTTRIFNPSDNAYNILSDLPSAPSGYKLTNKMTEINGPVNTNLSNFWFTSNEDMSPTGEKISSIPVNYVGDLKLYSFETPNNYKVNFITILEGEIILLDSLDCLYDKDYFYEVDPLIREGYISQGWYSSEQDISSWYFDNDELINGTPQNNYGATLSNLTTQDNVEINFYSYYIPKAYYINYHWLNDNYSGTFNPPEPQKRIFNQGNTPIEIIPYSSYYIIDNEGTINWYYFENNDTSSERLINTQEYILATDPNNYDFYAIREASGAIITFNVNNSEYGTLFIEGANSENIYEEGDIIKVSVSPFENFYFSDWSDGNNQPQREIVVGLNSFDYVANFRSNKILGALGVFLSDGTPLKNVYKGTEPIYK